MWISTSTVWTDSAVSMAELCVEGGVQKRKSSGAVDFRGARVGFKGWSSLGWGGGV